jgi:hypothetical protein
VFQCHIANPMINQSLVASSLKLLCFLVTEIEVLS